jgi:hypothetical protein
MTASQQAISEIVNRKSAGVIHSSIGSAAPEKQDDPAGLSLVGREDRRQWIVR